MIKTRVLAALALCAGLVAAENAAALAERPTSGGAPPISVEAPAAPEAPEAVAPRATLAAARPEAAEAPPALDLALEAGAPVTAAPVTRLARLAPAAAQTEIDAGVHEQALTLRFEDLQAAEGGAPFVRVFVGKGDADAETSVENPHFAGAVSFFPVPMQTPQEIKMNVGPTRDRLRRMGLPADSVTLVLVTPPSASPSASAAAESVDGSGFGTAARAAPPALPSVRVTRIELE